MEKNSFLKLGYHLIKSFLSLAVIFAFSAVYIIIFAPPVVGRGSLNGLMSTVEKRNSEILAQNNALENEDEEKSGEDPSLDPQSKSVLETEDKGTSGEREIPPAEDVEDVQNGPDDPE